MQPGPYGFGDVGQQGAPPGWGPPVAPPRAPRPRVPVGTIVAIVLGAVALSVVGVSGLVVTVIKVERVQTADLIKLLVALTAATLALGDSVRAALRGKVPRPIQQALGIALALTAIVAYFNGFSFGYPKFYHRWEQFHAYVGAKYFPELGYEKLYQCTAVAEDELGTVRYTRDNGSSAEIDVRAEVRRSGGTVRDLGGDHLLVPIAPMLDHPEICKDRFSPQRWERFKQDIGFFRSVSDRGYWEDMQKDHGYSMPPVWTIVGRLFAELHAPSVGYLQFLGTLDLFYLLGMFAALWWAFGWRVASVAAIFWGCQSIAPFYWTGGAFLRQDWLFYLVLSACLLKKRRFSLAGAAMVYACLLRIFPVYAAAGWVIFGAAHFFRHRRLDPGHRRVLIGALVAAAVLVPTSMLVAGKSAYSQFYERAVVYQETPLTNHMGLPVLVSQDLGTGPGSGRMELAKDPKRVDPFETWKRIRSERYDRYFWVGALIVALSAAGFIRVIWRLRTGFIAACLAQVFIVLCTQLTCFNYPFLVLAAPLTRARRGLEVPLFLFAALTQVLSLGIVYNDMKYTALTALSLVFCLGMVAAFFKASRWKAKENKNASVYR